jgi:hypothetical protein
VALEPSAINHLQSSIKGQSSVNVKLAVESPAAPEGDHLRSASQLRSVWMGSGPRLEIGLWQAI